MVFASDFKLEHAFGVQVTFIDDHGNYISMEDENSQQNTAKVERIVESVAKAVPFSEISNISLKESKSEESDMGYNANNQIPTKQRMSTLWI